MPLNDTIVIQAPVIHHGRKEQFLNLFFEFYSSQNVSKRLKTTARVGCTTGLVECLGSKDDSQLGLLSTPRHHHFIPHTVPCTCYAFISISVKCNENPWHDPCYTTHIVCRTHFYRRPISSPCQKAYLGLDVASANEHTTQIVAR